MIVSRGFGGFGGLITVGFATTISAIVEEARRKRRRGSAAVREFEDYIIRAVLVSVNGNKPIKEISSRKEGSILIEDNRSVIASGVDVKYINSTSERIVITASRVVSGISPSLTRRKPGQKPEKRIAIKRNLKG